MLKQLRLRSLPLGVAGVEIAIVLILFLGSFLHFFSSSPNLMLATKIGKEIIASCPVVANVQDKDAYNFCAEQLSQLKLLRDTMSPSFRWGGQKEINNYNIQDSETTTLDPYVWRRMYLSTFMFEGEPRVEQLQDTTVIHLPSKFRNEFDRGAYPYPFWHAPKKWDSYQQTQEVLLFLKNNKLIGGLRSATNDLQRKKVKHQWDGKWQWQEKGKPQPYVSLYDRLFSATNPHTTKLDAAYRAFATQMREHSCYVCHSPDNANRQNPLLILSYPNQALTLRHETVHQIQNRLMPPPNGITDDKERQKLVELAKVFADAGDRALAYEGEKQDSSRT